MHGSYVTQYQGADDLPEQSTEPETLRELTDDGQSVIGISLGPEQTRLASPTATEEQKFLALHKSREDADKTRHKRVEQGDTTDAADARPLDEDAPSSSTLLQEQSALPTSPWRAGPKTQWTSVDGVWDGRPRSLSLQGENKIPSSTAKEDSGWRKYIPSLPSLPQGFSSASNKAKTASPARTPARSRAASFRTATRSSTLPSSPTSQSPTSPSQTTFERKPSSPAQQTSNRVISQSEGLNAPSRPSLLRRSTSDSSLYLHRSLSRASSLGDDSRWTDVHEQVNSRAKAIRDSIADSNIRLPRLPDLPTFNIGEALADFQASRKRSASALSNRIRRAGSPVKRADDAKPAAITNVESSERLAEMSPPPGMTKTNAEAHPNFTRALKQAKGDLVVMGGYRGSILRSAQPPNRQLWVPVKVGLGIRKVNLEVGFEREDEDSIEDTVIPGGMLKNIGPVDISRRLFKRLASCKNTQDGNLHVWDFGYDWRLSPHRLSDYLINFLEGLKCNSPSTPQCERGATVVAHSLGGLITRHAVNRRPELFRGVVYAAAPQTCVNILGPLRHGDEVLLSSRVLTAQVNFSIRTSFALLPLDGKCFFNRETEERFDVDFFDPQQWEQYCWSPCIARPLPVTAKAQTSFFGGIVNSMTNAMPAPTVPGRSRADSKAKPNRQSSGSSPPAHSGGQHAVSVQMGQREEPTELGEDPETAPSTMVTVPKAVAMQYLSRTLAEVKQFKQELAFDPAIDARGAYPPTAVIYGKAVPTVYGACVKDRESIKRADAYDDLAFASGDGVVLARAAQLPEGYKATKGGVVSSDRGHIGLLGDLEAIGRCLNAIHAERRKMKRCEGKKPANDVTVDEDAGRPTAGIE